MIFDHHCRPVYNTLLILLLFLVFVDITVIMTSTILLTILVILPLQVLPLLTVIVSSIIVGIYCGSFPLTVTVTTMGNRSYNCPLNKAPLRTVTGRGNDPIYIVMKADLTVTRLRAPHSRRSVCLRAEPSQDLDGSPGGSL